jgi:hypothetical protein
VKAGRYLFPARDANLDEKARAALQKALDLCPSLRVLRDGDLFARLTRYSPRCSSSIRSRRVVTPPQRRPPVAPAKEVPTTH